MPGQASEQFPERSFEQDGLNATDSHEPHSLPPTYPFAEADRLEGERHVGSELEPFFTLSLDMLCIADFDGYFKRLNPAWEKTLGYTQAELLSKPYLEFVHPDDRAATIAEAQRLIEGAETIEFENRYRCKNGSYRWLMWNAKAFPETQRLYGIAHDITERKQIEASRERQALIFETMSNGVILTDLEGRIFDWNPAAERMFGYTKAEVLGQTPGILHKPEETTVLTQQIIDGMLLNGRWSGEITFIRKDGTEGVCETIVAPLNDQYGQLIATIGVNHDITARKRAEAERDRLVAILEASIDHIGMADAQGKVFWNNAQAKRILGLAPDADISHLLIKDYHPKWALEIIQNQGLPTAIQQGVWVGETALLCGDGSELPVSQMIIAHKSPEGEVTHFSTVMRDISQLKQTEKALRESEKQYRRIVETIAQGVWMLDPQGKKTFVKRQMVYRLGQSMEERGGTPMFAFIYEADQVIVERKVRLELTLLEQILEIVLAGYWDWDIPNHREYMSPRLKRMFGYEDHELPNVPESWQKLIFPEDLPQVLDRFEQHIQSRGQIPYYNEVRYRHKNGSTVWVICSGQVIEWDQAGKPLRMIGCHIDITERKQAESALQREMQRSQLLADITLKIRQSLQFQVILQTTVTEVQALLRADRALILHLEATGDVQVMAEAINPRWASANLQDNCLSLACLQRYRQGCICRIPDVEQAGLPDCLLDCLHHFQVKSFLSIPVLLRQELWGMLIVHQCSHIRTWSTFEIDLLKQLANQLGIAITQSHLVTALRQSQQRFLNAFEYAAIGMALVAPDGRWLQVNQALCEIVGYSEPELLSMTFQAITHPDHLEADLDSLRQLLAGEIRAYQAEKRYVHKLGHAVWIWLSVSLVRDAHGQPLHFVSQIKDISDRKWKEEILGHIVSGISAQTGKAFFHSLVKYLSKVLQVEFSFVCQLSDVEAEYITTIASYEDGQPIENFQYDLKNTPCEKVVRNQICAYPENVQQSFPLDPLLRDLGIESYLGAPLVDSTGRVLGLIAVLSRKPLQNIQLKEEILKIFAVRASSELERKLAEQALQDSEQSYATLAQSAPVGIFRADAEGNCLYNNEHLSKISGLSPQAAMGKGWVKSLHPEDRDLIAAAWVKAVQTDLPFSAEYRLMRPDGVVTWVYAQAVAERAPDGRITGYVGTVTDITERLRMEEMRRALEREKELSELKLGFFSMASHEFRTPLSIILFAAQVLENSEPEWLDAKKLRNIHRIQDMAKNMAQMLTDVLILARAEAQKIEFNPKPFNLQQFCRHILQEIELSLKFGTSIRLTYEGGNCAVYMDEKLLHSILVNLLSNALKYSSPGSDVDFDVACKAEVAIFTIQDRGIGISVADQAHLFEPFHRGENVGEIEGSGLGLAVVKRCVELHGGDITVQSCLDSGTTFIVQIPIGSENQP